MLAQIFGIDRRTLALFRELLALVLLYNLAGRAIDLSAMYTDAGIMPREAVRAYYGDGWQWSLHMLSGDAAWQIILFVLAALFALQLLVGWYTKIATIASWGLLVSLHARAPLLVNGGDVLLAMLLFWSMFLPLGSRASVDAWRKRNRAATEGPTTGKPDASASAPTIGEPDASASGLSTSGTDASASGVVLSVASAAILLQIAFMYFFSGLVKCNALWLEGRAIENALQYSLFVTAVGEWLLDYPETLKLVTWGTLALELAGPWLLFCPWKSSYVRTATVLALAGMHVGIELTMIVAVFSLVSLAGLALFLPSALWETRALQMIRICAAWADSFIGKPKATADVPKHHRLRLAVKRASGAATGGANTRRNAGRRASLLLQPQNGLAGLFLLLVLALNVSSSIDYVFGPRPLPGFVYRLSELSATGQKWHMYSQPDGLDYRYIARGETGDGRAIDVLRDGASAPLDRPLEANPKAPNARWMLVYLHLAEAGMRPFRQSVAEYFFRQWNASAPVEDRLIFLDLLYIRRRAAETHDDAHPYEIIQMASVDADKRFPIERTYQEGFWVFLHATGHRASEGTYRNGEKEGKWTFWHPRGAKSHAGNYKNDLAEGPWKFWSEDGRLKEKGEFRDGKMHGRWRFFNDDGAVEEDWYDEGALVNDRGGR